MASVKPPFVLVEGLDVSVWRSLTDLTGQVEALDVRVGTYEAFDSEGRIVILNAESDRGPVLAATGELAAPRLRDALIAHLVAVGHRPPEGRPIGETPLQALIDQLVRSQGGPLPRR